MVDSNTEMLPPELKFGYVYNRVVRAIGDTNNDDDSYPDGIPAEGTVTFKPKRSVKNVASDGQGYTVTREPITCEIDDGSDNPKDVGLLVDEAGTVGGVWLPTGEWTASYNFSDRFSNVPDVTFVLTEEHTKDNPLDLALITEIPQTPTVKFVVNEQIYVDSKKARDQSKGYRDEAQSAAESVSGSVESISGVEDTVKSYRDEIMSKNIKVDTSAGVLVSIDENIIFYDSGTLDFTEFEEGITSGKIYVRRMNNQVELNIVDVKTVESDTSWYQLEDFLPEGFRPARQSYFVMPARNSSYTEGPLRVNSSGNTYIYSMRDEDIVASVLVTFSTDDDIPKSLPVKSE